MGGTKFRGNIIENSSSRGSFCPKDSKINFIVPSEPSLKAQTESLDIPNHIEPGIIPSMLEFFNEKSKDVILNCDGKLIRRALTESSGDVDLQGAEHGPSLIERQNILRAELDIVGKCISKH